MRPLICFVAVCLFLSCNADRAAQTGTAEGATDRSSTTTGAVQGAAGADTSAYNLPGADTAAIHKNTNEPGVLDKDAESRHD